jgi:hypothetical protein
MPAGTAVGELDTNMTDNQIIAAVMLILLLFVVVVILTLTWGTWRE